MASGLFQVFSPLVYSNCFIGLAVWVEGETLDVRNVPRNQEGSVYQGFLLEYRSSNWCPPFREQPFEAKPHVSNESQAFVCALLHPNTRFAATLRMREKTSSIKWRSSFACIGNRHGLHCLAIAPPESKAWTLQRFKYGGALTRKPFRPAGRASKLTGGVGLQDAAIDLQQRRQQGPGNQAKAAMTSSLLL